MELTALAGAAVLMKRVSTDMNIADTRHRRPLCALIPTRRGTAGMALAVILMNMGITDMNTVSIALVVILMNTALADALMNIRHAAAGVSIRTGLQTG